MKTVVTGAAGFIGFHVANSLLARGDAVVGVDNLNPYYDVSLKRARADALAAHGEFSFVEMDVSDRQQMRALTAAHQDAEVVVHLAAQAGVRHAFDHPEDYIQSNITGHFEVVEMCRRLPQLRHCVYASTSSVYGDSPNMPYAEDARVDSPVSLYAATKKADELISYVYARLYKLPMTGLRFFTVYGPWGRPDMSAFLFTKAILAGEPIKVFNYGDMLRDFTYIDDIVAGVLASLDHPPAGDKDGVPHRLYNIGHNRPEPLMRFIEVIEQACGRKAEIDLQPMPPGDIKATAADISAIQRDFGFEPKTSIEEGIPRFVAWYRDYYRA